MKKTLFSIAIASLGFLSHTNAQSILIQNFDSPTIPALPTGWAQGSTGSPGWKTATFPVSGWGTATGTTLPAHATQIGLIDDWNDTTASNLYDTLKSPAFAIASGMTDVWLNYDYYFFNAVTTATPTHTETAYVLGSSDGGGTWTVLDTLEGWAWNEVWHTGHTSLSALGTGTNMKVAFAYSDGGGRLLGCALDNVEVLNLTANAAAVPALDYNSAINGIATNATPLSFQVDNKGKTITSFDAYYTINSGTPVTQSFTGLSIAPYTSQVFTFTTAMSGAVSGSNSVKIVVTNVNTTTNTEPDSLETSSFVLASASVQRNGLIEEFSSSTCAPCKAFNASYDPLTTSMNVNAPITHINILKYQMNWPSPGTDRSYNSDGDARKTYYGVNGIPEHFVNGITSSLGWGSPFSSAQAVAFTDEANNSKARNSFFDITVKYSTDTVKKKLYVVTTVTPHVTITGAYHLNIAVADKYYTNSTNTTGQTDYYHVMRKMLPSASGRAISSWTDGVAQTFYDTGIAYTNGNYIAGSTSYPTQLSNMFWSNPMFGSEVAAFVQQDANQSIMQSLVTVTNSALGVSTLSKVDGIEIYPNPAKNVANVKFNLQEAGSVHVKVMDYTGRLVSDVVSKEMAAGTQNVAVNIGNIAPGNYLVVISTDGGNNAERLTIEK